MPITKPYDPDMFAPGFKDLGTPTKGSVIAGNGSTWQKLGVGANGTVLTANSGETTGLEWAAGGGGGGIYTVVADEAELISALAAEDPLIYIDTSITATQDYSVTADTEVRVGTNVSLTMGGSYSFVVASGIDMTLTGNNQNNSILNYNMTTERNIIELSGVSKLTTNNIRLVETAASTNAGSIIPENMIANIRNTTFIFFNDDGGFNARIPYTYSSSEPSIYENIIFTGGGSSCNYKIGISGITFFTNIIINGTWHSDVRIRIQNGYFGFVNNLYILSSITGRLELSAAEISNVNCTGINLYVSFTHSASNLSCDTLYANNTSSVTGFYCSNVFYANSNNGYFSDGEVDNACSFSARDHCIFSSIRFNGGASISLTDYFLFIACTFGEYLSPGSGLTLTIAGTSTQTTVVACQSDVAIADGGISSSLGNNTVF